MCIETAIDSTDKIMPAENHKLVIPALPEKSAIPRIVDENVVGLCF